MQLPYLNVTEAADYLTTKRDRKVTRRMLYHWMDVLKVLPYEPDPATKRRLIETNDLDKLALPTKPATSKRPKKS
jgi:hypothetical protein